MDPLFILQVTFIGCATGILYYLTASGISLIVSGIGIVNMAQGAFYVLGAFLAIQYSSKLGFGLSCILIPIFVGLFGFVFEKLIRPLLGKGLFYVLLMSFGLSLIVSDITYYIWGGLHDIVSKPKFLRGNFNLLGMSFSKYYLFIYFIGIVIYISYWLMMEKTKLGKLLRATMTDKEMVVALGYNMNFLHAIMIAIAISISALGGILSSAIQSFDTKSSITVFSNVLPIIFIGGLRNIKGSMPAALLVGLLSSFAAVLTPQFYSMVPAACMVIVMLFRPHGLFTKEEV